MMRILLIGGSGMLGAEVQKKLQTKSLDVVWPRSSELDIRDFDSVSTYLSHNKPEWIINCAAWADVVRAEDEFEAACELNFKGPYNLAIAAGQYGCTVIQISTDYVFNGMRANAYVEDSETSPINKYGASKELGEKALLENLPKAAYVLRTSWLYGVNGKNFVKTIAEKALKQESVQVVNDQIGSPTNARDLAGAIVSLIDTPPEPGIYHYSNAGSCSWFEFAQSIYALAGFDPNLVEAVDSEAFNSKVSRPKYSLLSKEKWISAGLSEVPYWEDSLQLVLPEIIAELG